MNFEWDEIFSFCISSKLFNMKMNEMSQLGDWGKFCAQTKNFTFYTSH
jgi:hypothetical protein